MTTTYEGMFLLDNQVVREDWNGAKAAVTDMLKKHDATVLSARRWDERKLAYSIGGSLRATYLLTYFEIPGDNIPAMTRDFNLNERVLRYIQLSVEKLPEGELELAEAENADDFTIPAPPPDDAPDLPEEGEESKSDRNGDIEDIEVPEGDLADAPTVTDGDEVAATAETSNTSEEKQEG